MRPSVPVALLTSLRSAQRRAQREKRKFSLGLEWLASVAAQKHCDLTGLPLEPDDAMSPLSPSIDRKDNSKGYTPENVRVVCHFANVARNVWSDAQLKALILASAAHLKA